MARLFVQYLAIYEKENLPNSLKNWQKKGQNFSKYKINLEKWPKYA